MPSHPSPDPIGNLKLPTRFMVLHTAWDLADLAGVEHLQHSTRHWAYVGVMEKTMEATLFLLDAGREGTGRCNP